jgi:hypothetical protein
MRCTNFSNLFLEYNFTCFGQVSYHQGSSTVYTAIGICHTGFGDCLLAGSEWNILILLVNSQKNLYDIYLLLCRLLMMDRKPVRNT